MRGLLSYLTFRVFVGGLLVVKKTAYLQGFGGKIFLWVGVLEILSFLENFLPLRPGAGKF